MIRIIAERLHACKAMGGAPLDIGQNPFRRAQFSMSSFFPSVAYAIRACRHNII
jgi:hypothetical protein